MKTSKLLLLGLLIVALAVPALAITVTVSKNTSPDPEGVYQIGQQVHYVLDIPNGSTSTAMTVKIKDIFPVDISTSPPTPIPGVSDTYWYYPGTPGTWSTTPPSTNNVTIPANTTWTESFYVTLAPDDVRLHPTIPGTNVIANRVEALGWLGAEPVEGAVTKISFVLQPSIGIKKYVSVDGGTTWDDAETITGPIATFPGTVKFKVVVTNTGDVDLTSVVVNDTDFTFLGVVGSLAIGASDESDILEVASVVGQHANTADVSAYYGTTEVTDSDMAHYYVAPAPAIEIKKYVSVDGGTTWDDAETATGPTTTVGSDVKFKVVVTKTGNVDLTSVVVSDTDFIFLGVVGSLAVGASDESDVLTTTAVLGQHANTAGVSAYYETTEVTDSDMAHYIGSIDNPGIHIEKATNDEDADYPYGPFIMVGDTVTWTYVVTNTGTGNVPLTGVVVIDDNGTPGDLTDDFSPTPVDDGFGYNIGDINQDNVLDLTETWLYEATGTAEAGQYANEACVVAYFDTVDVYDCDPSHYYGVVCYSETAFGLGNSSACFIDLDIKLKANRWGWTHGPLAAGGTYTFDIWAGAGQCDTSKGTYVGTVEISYNGGNPIVTPTLEPDFEIVETHLYIGSTQLPQVAKGKKTEPTVAPGQYYIEQGLTGSNIYIIYHTVVQWCDYPEEPS